MGDRRQAVLHYATIVTPIYLYTHWHGYSLPTTIAQALDRGRARWHDEAYLAKIITAEMIQDNGGVFSETGMGISPYPTSTEDSDINILLASNHVAIGTDIFTFEDFIEQTLKKNSEGDDNED